MICYFCKGEIVIKDRIARTAGDEGLMTAAGEARGMGTCHQCGAAITGAVRFRDTCPSCQAYLHCCLNCANYDTSSSNHCREPLAEWVSDRERANFCDFFRPTQAAIPARARGQSGPLDEARSAFENLFKK